MCTNRYVDMLLQILKVDLDYQKDQNVSVHFLVAGFTVAAAECSVVLRTYRTDDWRNLEHKKHLQSSDKGKFDSWNDCGKPVWPALFSTGADTPDSVGGKSTKVLSVINQTGWTGGVNLLISSASCWLFLHIFFFYLTLILENDFLCKRCLPCFLITSVFVRVFEPDFNCKQNILGRNQNRTQTIEQSVAFWGYINCNKMIK